MQSLMGIVLLFATAYVWSEDRGSISWRFVVVAFSFHVSLAIFLLKIPAISEGLVFLNEVITWIQNATNAGSSFVFGFLGGGEAPFKIEDASQLFIFAFSVLPQVLVFSVIVALLWHWKILPLFIKGVGRVLSKILGIKGPIATAGAASLFLGMVETPLVIRAYLNAMTKTELFSVMTLGMSTIAGSVLVLYSSILGGVTDAAIGQIIAASIMNIVGAFYISQIFFPELTQVHRREPAILSLSYDSTMDALTKGTRDGVNLAVNVGAMVLVLVSLVALVNGILGNFEIFGAQITLQRLLGWFFSPIAWLIGIPWPEAGIAGSLLGTKLVLNELVAYIQLSEVSPLLSEHSRVVMVFALCGFANFGSLGILLGGLYFLIPERQDEVVVMAPKSIASGTMVTLMTGSIVSLVISF